MDRWIPSRALALLLGLVATAAVACENLDNPLDPGEDGDDGQQPHAEVAEQLEERWGAQVESFVVRDLAMDEIAAGLEAGSATFPLVDETGEVREVTLDAGSVSLRAPDLDNGVQRSGPTTDPAIEEVPLPPEQNYVLGTCEDADEVSSETLTCGAGTLLDDDRIGPVLDRELPIEQAEEACEGVRRSEHVGKVALRVP
jgi:hypothetical protein